MWLWNSLCSNLICSPSARAGFICHCLTRRLSKQKFPKEWAEVILSAAKYIECHGSRAGLVLGTSHANTSITNHAMKVLAANCCFQLVQNQPSQRAAQQQVSLCCPKGFHCSAPLVPCMKCFYGSLPCLKNRCVGTERPPDCALTLHVKCSIYQTEVGCEYHCNFCSRILHSPSQAGFRLPRNLTNLEFTLTCGPKSVVHRTK